MVFSDEIILWYNQNKRDLPWRTTSSPYKIWLSEIILQQTRVNQGLPYYYNFLEKFPAIEDLAAAEEQEVLKLWQGLGYYSRARNMHKAAKQIAFDLKGEFPTNKKKLLDLKGVGEYTASAIASFCFNEAAAVVDGNVYRVISRFFGLDTPIDSTEGKKMFNAIAHEQLNSEQPALHNQAIMEFGALQCIPKKPQCINCPLQHECYALKNKLVDKLPKKSKKIKQKSRFFYYLDLRYDSLTYLIKRGKKDIWENLYEFPMIETNTETEIDEVLNSDAFNSYGFQGVIIEEVLKLKNHKLSHQVLHPNIIRLRLTAPPKNSKFITINKDKIHLYPTHRLMENYLKTLDANNYES